MCYLHFKLEPPTVTVTVTLNVVITKYTLYCNQVELQ